MRAPRTNSVFNSHYAEWNAMIDALKAASGKIAGAAEPLDLKRTMLQNKARRLNISGPTTRSGRFAYTPETNSLRS